MGVEGSKFSIRYTIDEMYDEMYTLVKRVKYGWHARASTSSINQQLSSMRAHRLNISIFGDM